MKKIALVSLIAFSTMAYATTTEEHDTRALPNLSALEPCDMPVDCSSLSPLQRSVCILKGLGTGTLSFGCLAMCIIGGHYGGGFKYVFGKGDASLLDRCKTLTIGLLAAGTCAKMGEQCAKSVGQAIS